VPARKNRGTSAVPNLTPISTGNFRRKVVYAKPGRRQQLMKIPKRSNVPWPGRPFAISVRVYAADTLRPARSTVWYKEPLGFNTDLKTHRKGHPDHRHHWWVDRLSRVDIGSLRLRAWKSKTTGRVFVVEYQPGDIVAVWPDPQSRRVPGA
jgi:hypothetical protein